MNQDEPVVTLTPDPVPSSQESRGEDTDREKDFWEGGGGRGLNEPQPDQAHISLKRLATAIITTAAKDAKGEAEGLGGFKNRAAKERAIQEGKDFFLHPDWRTSLEFWCSLADLNPDYLLKKVNLTAPPAQVETEPKTEVKVEATHS